MHPAEDAKPVEGAVTEGARVVRGVGKPQIGRPAGFDAREPRARDADDFHLAILERQPAADDGGIGAETLDPERMAEDGDRVCRVAAIVAGGDEPAGRRCHAEGLERVAGEILRADALLVLRAGKDDRPDDLRAHREEVDVRRAGVAQRHEQGIAEGVGLGPIRVVGRKGQVNELVGRANGQRPEDERVEEGVRGGAGSERQGQRDDGGGRHARVPPQHARSHAHVAQQRFEPRQQFHVAALLLGAQGAPETALGLGCGLLWRQARRRQLLDPPIEVEPELLVEIVIDPLRSKNVGDPGPERHVAYLATRASESCRRPR